MGNKEGISFLQDYPLLKSSHQPIEPGFLSNTLKLNPKRLDKRFITNILFWVGMDNEHSYLDISPSQRIADIVKVEDPDFSKVPGLVAEVVAYINVMEEENVKFYEDRRANSQSREMSEGETYRFLRSQERVRNTKLLLQYLVTFMTDMPLQEAIQGKPVNPFLQLKLFSINSVSLLKEKDVETAILKEHQRLNLLNETNVWYYRGQVDRSYKKIYTELQAAGEATVEGYCKIFQALQDLCTFWFSVRNQQIQRVRKSDLMVYKLTRVLLAIHQQGIMTIQK